MSGKWVRQLSSQRHAHLALFCFPHAGGSVSTFRDWPASLPPSIDVFGVQLPGRADRINEPALTDLRSLTDLIVEAMQDHCRKPCLLFGHSMGAVLAFEVARALEAESMGPPVHLMISARRAPSVPARGPDLHLLDDDALIAGIDARYEGIPAAFRDHPDVLALMLPTVRADLAALEKHRSRRKPALACPITAFARIIRCVYATRRSVRVGNMHESRF